MEMMARYNSKDLPEHDDVHNNYDIKSNIATIIATTAHKHIV